MDKELKEKWVAALRSGEIEQANRRLLDADGAMCCVGVLARICGVTDETMIQNSQSLYSQGLEPVGVAVGEGSAEILFRLADMNDHQGKNFKEIADYIEKTL